GIAPNSTDRPIAQTVPIYIPDLPYIPSEFFSTACNKGAVNCASHATKFGQGDRIWICGLNALRSDRRRIDVAKEEEGGEGNCNRNEALTHGMNSRVVCSALI